MKKKEKKTSKKNAKKNARIQSLAAARIRRLLPDLSSREEQGNAIIELQEELEDCEESETTEEAATTLLELIEKESDDDWRSNLLTLLCSCPHPAQVERVAAMLDEFGPLSLHEALFLIGEAGNKQHEGILRRYANHSDKAIRSQAENALIALLHSE